MIACKRPPAGWWCSRGEGHEGPCAARETTSAAAEAVCGEPTGPDSATTEQRGRPAHRAQSISPTAREGQGDLSTSEAIPEVLDERERAASCASRIAYIMENGGGETKPGERLRQVERMIREGDDRREHPSYRGTDYAPVVAELRRRADGVASLLDCNDHHQRIRAEGAVLVLRSAALDLERDPRAFAAGQKRGDGT